jgi:hypothetical protein
MRGPVALAWDIRQAGNLSFSSQSQAHLHQAFLKPGI